MPSAQELMQGAAARRAPSGAQAIPVSGEGGALQPQAPAPAAALIDRAKQRRGSAREEAELATGQAGRGLVAAFTGEGKRTPDIEGLPEIGSLSTGDIGKDLKIAGGLLAAIDTEGQIDIIRNALPDALIETNENGITTIVSDGQKVVLNAPGFSQQDAVQAAAQIIALVPAAKLATLPANLAAKLGTAFSSGAITSVFLDKIAQAAGSEQPVSALRALITGGAEALVPGGGAAIRGGKKIVEGITRRGPADVIEETGEQALKAREATEATGVELFPAQQTALPSQLRRQTFVAELPAAAQKAASALKTQNQQALNAVQEVLDIVAPPTATSTGAVRFRSAAEMAIERAKGIRSEAASPIYKQAFRRQRQGKLGPIDTAALETRVNAQAAQFSAEGEIRPSLEKVAKKIAGAKGDLAKLHNAKIEIDQMLNKFGENSLGNTTKKFIADIQKEFVDLLKAQSPSYRAANAEFQRLSPDVTELTEGIIGQASNVKNPQLKSLSSKIFDAAETNPQVVRRTREVIDQVDPGAYDELLRVELERRMGSVRASDPAEAVGFENVPAQMWNAIFSNAKQRNVLFNALRPEQRPQARLVERALKRASLGRPGGSPTGSNELIKDELKGGVIRSIINFVRNPLKVVGEIGERAAIERNAAAVAELIYNPSYTKDVDAIIRMQAKQPTEAALMMRQLLTAIAEAQPVAATLAAGKNVPSAAAVVGARELTE